MAKINKQMTWKDFYLVYLCWYNRLIMLLDVTIDVNGFYSRSKKDQAERLVEELVLRLRELNAVSGFTERDGTPIHLPKGFFKK